MTRQIATGRAGRSYEIEQVDSAGQLFELVVDNDSRNVRYHATMEIARETAKDLDSDHVAKTLGCVGIPLPLIWTTVPV